MEAAAGDGGSGMGPCKDKQNVLNYFYRDPWAPWLLPQLGLPAY